MDITLYIHVLAHGDHYTIVTHAFAIENLKWKINFCLMLWRNIQHQNSGRSWRSFTWEEFDQQVIVEEEVVCFKNS